jgi:hypothetical protein
MTVRSLDLLDLPFLSRYRQDVLSLDSAGLLTRGNPLGASAMLSYLNPHRNIYTAVASENDDTLMGQIILKADETSARLAFLAPAGNVNGLTSPLLDHMAAKAGDWGAFHLLAEVDEDAPAFKSLRQAGFAMYAWQRVWKLPRLDAPDRDNSWCAAEETDWPAIQSLHGQIVPALLHPVENLPRQASGLVCRGPSASLRSAQGDLQAYVAVDSGTQGVWLQPLVPPDSTCVQEQLTGLVSAVASGNNRPVYVCVRSYQAWLESALADLGAEPGPRQAVMVRRLVKTIKETQVVPAMEKALAKAKPAAPVSRVENEK